MKAHVARHAARRRPRPHRSRAMTVGYTVVYPGCSARGHLHGDREEIYLVVCGRGSVTVGEEEFAVGPDDVVYIHQVRRTPRKMEN